MKFIDLNNDEIITPEDMKRHWEEMRAEDPDNFSPNFTEYMFSFLMDTINGRNDLEIIGLTGKEISNIVIKLREKVL